MSIERFGWSDSFSSAFTIHAQNSFVPARIAREDKERYIVLCERGEIPAEVSGKFRHAALSRRDYPAVGDWVAVSLVDNDERAIIHAVLPRKSSFSRKAAGDETIEQLVAANIDVLFLVMGLDADYSVRRLERYLTLAWESGATPVILLNKADVCADVESVSAEVAEVAFGVPVHTLSATTGAGVEALSGYLTPGTTIALLGSSGVGKSTLINTLLGEERLAVKELRYDGKGRHTTTRRELIVLPSGAILIDTPGMKELQLWASEESLSGAFEDIDTLAAQCRFRDCTHTKEPGCAVLAAAAGGRLSAERLASFRKLQRELRFLARKQDRFEAMKDRARWKQISKSIRGLEKGK